MTRGTPPGKVINPWLECSMLKRLPPGWKWLKKITFIYISAWSAPAIDCQSSLCPFGKTLLSLPDVVFWSMDVEWDNIQKPFAHVWAAAYLDNNSISHLFHCNVNWTKPSSIHSNEANQVGPIVHDCNVHLKQKLDQNHNSAMQWNGSFMGSSYQ